VFSFIFSKNGLFGLVVCDVYVSRHYGIRAQSYMQQIFPTQIPEGRHSRSSADIGDRSIPNFGRTQSRRWCSPSLC